MSLRAKPVSKARRIISGNCPQSLPLSFSGKIYSSSSIMFRSIFRSLNWLKSKSEQMLLRTHPHLFAYFSLPRLGYAAATLAA